MLFGIGRLGKGAGRLGFIWTDPESIPTGGTPANGYVAEDGTTFYVAEDGSTFYVQE